MPRPRFEGRHATTPIETHVAQLAAAGLSNAAIASTRGTSVHTVANQIAKILRESGLASRRALATLTQLDVPLAPAPVDWDLLTVRELTVVARVCRGTPQKVIALEVGLAQSTVSAALRSARLRVGLGSTADLLAAYVRRLGPAPAKAPRAGRR